MEDENKLLKQRVLKLEKDIYEIQCNMMADSIYISEIVNLLYRQSLNDDRFILKNDPLDEDLYN